MGQLGTGLKAPEGYIKYSIRLNKYKLLKNRFCFCGQRPHCLMIHPCFTPIMIVETELIQTYIFS